MSSIKAEKNFNLKHLVNVIVLSLIPYPMQNDRKHNENQMFSMYVYHSHESTLRMSYYYFNLILLAYGED